MVFPGGRGSKKGGEFEMGATSCRFSLPCRNNARSGVTFDPIIFMFHLILNFS